MPLTYLRKPDNCTDDLNCWIDVFTVLPFVRSENRYSLMNIQVLPLKIKNGADKQIVRMYKPPVTSFLSNEKFSWLEHNEDDYTCLPETPDQDCKLCYFKRTPKKIIDSCSHAIATATNMLTECPYEDVQQSGDVTIRINEREWIYAIDEPARIKTECDGEVHNKIIPKAGKLTFPEESECVYTMTNGPFMNFKPFMPGIKLEIEPGDVVSQFEKINNGFEIKQHFNEYGYIYVTVVFGIFLIVTKIFIIWKIRQCFKSKNARNLLKQIRNKNAKKQTTIQRIPYDFRRENRFLDIPNETRREYRVVPFWSHDVETV